MKKYFLFACTAAALVSCSSDDFLGEDQGLTQKETGAIVFQSSNMKAQRAKQVGATAAATLGNNFIVEGLKGAETTTGQASTVVFDNYLVVWEENTAGKTEDNTNDWRYVGVTASDKMAASELTGLGRTVSEQSIKYWDYSTENYAFTAYSAGTLKMVSTTDPVAGTSVKVTKIANPLGANTYTFTAKSAADLLNCYYTDVTPVAKANYGKPVTLTFKNLAAKVRIGMYETVPGYSVKDVKFYADNDNIKYTAVASPSHADVFTSAVWDASNNEFAVGTTWVEGTYYSATGADDAKKINDNSTIHGDVTTQEYFNADGTSIAKYTAYNGSTTYYEPTAPSEGTNATLYLSGTNVFPEAGVVTVSYNKLGTDNATDDGYNKATVSVAPESGSTTTTKTFGDFTANYTGKETSEAEGNIYLGRTLATATMAGTAGDNYYTAVIPVSTGAALTLRCNYTLVSTDGSGETIKVWGAKAVVPANFCDWKSNYAYTYIFKISDNTNGSTEKLGGTPEGLFPITFDAVVADITDVNGEQTTVTTVATPSVTTYQEGHKQGEEYKAGDIYVQSMKDGNPQVITNALIYNIPDASKATEADVIDALQMGTTDGSGNVTGRNGLVLTKTALLSTTVTTIPGADGKNITVDSGKAGKFTAVANKNYVFVYDYTTGDPAESELYSYDNAASTAAPSDWNADATNPYYTKNIDGTYTQVTTAWAAGTYYKKYKNNNHTYAVKVIKTGTAY